MPAGGWIGSRLARREDAALLCGAGRFTADLSRPGEAHAAVVRCPHARARILRVDAAPALARPGVLDVLSAASLPGEAAGPIPSGAASLVAGRDGAHPPEAAQPLLAGEEARFAGEPVAFVVAETAEAARDAAEAVSVDYEPLEPVLDPDPHPRDPSRRVWPGHDGNVSLDWERGDAGAVRAALAGSARVVRARLVNNRICPVFMEPRAALGEHDPATGRLTLHTGCQSAHGLRAALAEVLGVPPAELRVVVPEMGGGFGARSPLYPEQALVLIAARRLGRPVRWVATRAESFLTDLQSRGHVLEGELGVDAEGRFTALRVRVEWRHGAYLAARNTWVMVNFLVPTLGGVYRIPRGHVRLRGTFTSTTPVAAYRGIGRVEATYLTESLVDAAARACGLDRLEMRRRNLVRRADQPWTAPGGATYEACDFAACLERAAGLADPGGFAARREASRRAGRLRGLGLALYVENDGGAPADHAGVEVAPAGEIVARVGTQDFGMGHATTYAQVLADALGLTPERVRVIEGDTDAVARGAGSHGSRSVRIGGSALVRGAEAVIERGRALAADLLEAAAADVDYAAGAYVIAGTDRSVGLFEVAARAAERGERLAAEADFETRRASHSSGAHACEVEVDPDTGRVRIARHVVIADAGRAVNPMLVEGQMHGGAAQGLGQAALESVAHDADTGQPLSGSFMDYAIPRADDLPAFETAILEAPETDNPLAAKGVGEGPTTGAPAAFMSALRDALVDAGADPEAVQMPATPLAVWSALRAAGATR